MPKHASLGELEHAIMDVLWTADARRGLTVREVLDRLTGRDLAYTTIMTVLSRLEGKGVTTRERDGRAWRYRPASSRESLTADAMRGPLHALSDADRQAAILHFLAEASADELDAVREAMAAVEAKGDRPRPRRDRGAADSARVIAALLLACAAALLLAPPALVRLQRLRRSPRAALLLWQALSLSAVLCLLTAAPLALVHPRPRSAPAEAAIFAVACIASVGVLGRLLSNGHHVGRRIRAARAEHRELVDVVGRHEGERTRVLPSVRVSAYCVPGAGSRLVLTEATLTALPDDQLAAVVAHEEAHLRERHDLILEFFTVLHTATPRLLRTDAALREVALLVEVLADRAARAQVGEVALGRAILSLAEATSTQDLTPGASAGAGAATTRLRLLIVDDPAPWQTLVLHLAGVIALVTPPVLAVLIAA